jgi:hypothetical protein
MGWRIVRCNILRVTGGKSLECLADQLQGLLPIQLVAFEIAYHVSDGKFQSVLVDRKQRLWLAARMQDQEQQAWKEVNTKGPTQVIAEQVLQGLSDPLKRETCRAQPAQSPGTEYGED